MSESMVRITIGMPVYNGERTLAAALEALLAQTHPAFRLVISDNASTDATARICADFAARDARITSVRQPCNIGAEANFQFVLDQADGEYFMWAAADDRKSADFLATNLTFLEQHSDYVGSTCRVRFVGGEYDELRVGDQTRSEATAGERVLNFFQDWHANGRYYSLFRREALVRAKQGVGSYLASDWVVVVRLLVQGKLNRIDSGSVDLGQGGASQTRNFLASQRKHALHWVLPTLELWRATLEAVASSPAPMRWRIRWRLARLNAQVVQLALRIELLRWREQLRRAA